MKQAGKDVTYMGIVIVGLGITGELSISKSGTLKKYLTSVAYRVSGVGRRKVVALTHRFGGSIMSQYKWVCGGQ